MRDSIKSKTYFDEFITQDSERIERFQDKLNLGTINDERASLINYKIIYLKTGLIIAKYSRGDSIEEIKHEFEDMIDMFCEKGDVSIYEDNLSMASMAYLLDIYNGPLVKTNIKINLVNHILPLRFTRTAS